MEMKKVKRYFLIFFVVLICIIGTIVGASKYEQSQAYSNLINSANTDMEAGDYEEAIILFKQSLQYKDDPNIRQFIKLANNMLDAKNIFDNGLKYMETKNYLAAIDEFKKIARAC